MKTTRPVIVSSLFFFILSLCIIASLVEIRLESLLDFGKCAFTITPTKQSFNSSSDDIRVLVGILTLPDNYQRRHFLRLVYGTQYPLMGGQVDVKFVFCNLTKEEQKVLISLEIMRYNDIIILNCKENMDNGKTYTYFSSLPDIHSVNVDYPPYHYVMKGDDDVYIRLQNLVDSLTKLPREDLYYGFVVPCVNKDPFGKYMAGMGYLVSWDIVEWIRESEIPKNHTKGPEDRVFGDWIRDGNRGKNKFNAKWSMYDFPSKITRCTHELWSDTIAVHKLKNEEMWVETLLYFNATRNLQPSKLYHIDY